MSQGLLKTIVLLLFLILLCLSGLYDLGQWKRLQGERLLAAGEHRRALAAFSGTALLDNDSPRSAFNRGVARYRLGELDQAALEFQAALATSDRKLSQTALYNLGTTRLQQSNIQQERDRSLAGRHGAEAARLLGEARSLDKDDVDVQHNEAVARMLLATLAAADKKTGTMKKNEGASHQESMGGKNEKGEKAASKQQATAKLGQATDAAGNEGKHRRVTAMKRTDALRVLDDARGREMLRSTIAADSKHGRNDPPEKDW